MTEKPTQLRMDIIPDQGTPKFVPENPEMATERPKRTAAPQEQVYGGLTPRERWRLEHEPPDDGVYRGGN